MKINEFRLIISFLWRSFLDLLSFDSRSDQLISSWPFILMLKSMLATRVKKEYYEKLFCRLRFLYIVFSYLIFQCRSLLKNGARNLYFKWNSGLILIALYFGLLTEKNFPLKFKENRTKLFTQNCFNICHVQSSILHKHHPADSIVA